MNWKPEPKIGNVNDLETNRELRHAVLRFLVVSTSVSCQDVEAIFDFDEPFTPPDAASRQLSAVFRALNHSSEVSDV